MAIILGIESSCDDTSAAIISRRKILSNFVANQEVHAAYGGVVPELASRAHQQNIVPVVEAAIKTAGIQKKDIDAVAYTRGPGLLGSLLVGSSFAKGLAMALDKPLIEVNHMQAHILAHFIEDNTSIPSFPFLCLTVSGGHTQIVKVNSPISMEIIGETLDDAAGEAFDKVAKMMGIDYPGGPKLDAFAKDGDPNRFYFKVANVNDYNFSFSGLKTAVLYLIRDETDKNPDFLELYKNDLAASVQHSIISALIQKLTKAVHDFGIKEVAIAGGVSANSALRERLLSKRNEGWRVHIPKFEYCTDNAAMIAAAASFLHDAKCFGDLKNAPLPRMKL